MSHLELVSEIRKKHTRVFGEQHCACGDRAPCSVHKVCDDFLATHKRADELEVKTNELHDKLNAARTERDEYQRQLGDEIARCHDLREKIAKLERKEN